MSGQRTDWILSAKAKEKSRGKKRHRSEKKATFLF